MPQPRHHMANACNTAAKQIVHGLNAKRMRPSVVGVVSLSKRYRMHKLPIFNKHFRGLPRQQINCCHQCDSSHGSRFELDVMGSCL